MIEILEDEKKVLGCLVHAENLQTVVSETGLSPKVARDILRTLWHYRYIKAVDSKGKEVLLVDADLLHKAGFILTARGFEALEVR